MKRAVKHNGKFRPTRDDKEAWQDLASTVRKKKSANQAEDIFADDPDIIETPPKKTAAPRKSESPAESPAPKTAKQNLPPLQIGQRSDIDAASFRKLSRGKMPIDIKLDLHGYSREQAEAELLQSLPAYRRSGKRCLLVITGKGTGILQSALPQILNSPGLRPHVLCCVNAIPQHGGGGAFYVYLKK